MNRMIKEYRKQKAEIAKLMKQIETAIDVEEPSVTWGDIGDLEHILAGLRDLREFVTGTPPSYQVSARNHPVGCAATCETFRHKGEAELYAGHMTVCGFEVEMKEIHE